MPLEISLQSQREHVHLRLEIILSANVSFTLMKVWLPLREEFYFSFWSRSFLGPGG